jgi:methyl-accepting chemotaxis protein
VNSSLARQTNLLALNATIEATGSGEAGEGFAVVTHGVIELSKETAEAAADISRRIDTIQQDTKRAVEAIGQINSVISPVNEVATAIASVAEDQMLTTNEIAQNVNSALMWSSQVAENIQGVATAAKSTAQRANDLHAAADELARMAADTQELVGQFRYDGAGARL